MHARMRGEAYRCDNADRESVASSRAAVPDRRVEDLAATPAYVAKLYRKLRHAFMQRGVNGIPTLLPALRRVDMAREEPLDVWEVKGLLSNEGVKMSDREVEVLFHVFDHDGTGEVDLDMFLAELRLKLCCTQQQVEDLLRKIRSKMAAQRAASVFTNIDRHDDQLLHCGLFVKHTRRMRSACGLTPSDIVFLFCCFEENGVVSTCDFLAALQPPDDRRKLKDALLKLQNSCEDPDRTHSGCIGLARMMRRVADTDRLDREQFVQGLGHFGCGLRDSEIHLLFDAVQDDNGLASVSSLTGILQQNPPPASEEHTEGLLLALADALTAKDPYGLIHFKLALLQCFKGEKQRYVKSLHEDDPRRVPSLPASMGGTFEEGAGDCYLNVHSIGEVVRRHVPARCINDLGVEIVFNHLSVDAREVAASRRGHHGTADDLPTMVVGINRLVRVLRGSIPQGRRDLLRQTWHSIDPEESARVPYRDHFCRHFHPEATPDVRDGVAAPQDILSNLEAYTEHDSRTAAAGAGGVGDATHISQDTFFDFFSDYSAGVASDDAFRLTLWQGFEMNRKKRASPQEARYRADVTPSPTQESTAEQTVRKMREEEACDAVNPTTDEYHRRHHETREDHHTVSPPPYSRGGDGGGSVGGAIDAPPSAAAVAAVREDASPAPCGPPALSPRPLPHVSTPEPTPRVHAVPGASPNTRVGRRFVAGQGFGGGRSTLNIFGGDDEPSAPSSQPRRGPSIHVDPAAVTLPQQPQHAAQAHPHAQGRRAQPQLASSFTGSLRAASAAGHKQLHTERPF